jgi:PAS domain S-box-containing protein
LKTLDLPPPSQEDSLFQSAFDHAAIGMALVAPDGKWLRVNRALCDITGYSETELLERTFQDITHPEDLGFDLANVAKLLATEGATYQVEKRYFHKRGVSVWVRVSVSLVRDAAGQPRFFTSQIQDITSSKECERRLDEAAAEIKKLQRGLLKVCTWTKRINIEGQWISVDEFLRDRLGLKLTPGMSVEGGRLCKEQ